MKAPLVHGLPGCRTALQQCQGTQGPEGTRTADGRIQEFKHGAFKIAVRVRVPVVPVAIRGTFKLLPKSTLAPHPGRVDVFICAPIDTSECRERDLQGLVDAARSAIAAKLAG